ncbi:hypothetical protein Y032_0004g1764 [Ancylostoma ceylanicum]|uniref:Uncharacterized protein n=1 Tax=Ancylostoma ceylanicum TaxID=53326 RepID=A0A016VT50_9BILA|nr:hypothetical protein Y032_0004g1764 [Ancylostoma ceylanicum]
MSYAESLLQQYYPSCSVSVSPCYTAKLSGRPSLHQLQRDATRVETKLRPNMASAGAGRTFTYAAVRLYLQVQYKKERCDMKLEIDDWR